VSTSFAGATLHRRTLRIVDPTRTPFLRPACYRGHIADLGWMSRPATAQTCEDASGPQLATSAALLLGQVHDVFDDVRVAHQVSPAVEVEDFAGDPRSLRRAGSHHGRLGRPSHPQL